MRSRVATRTSQGEIREALLRELRTPAAFAFVNTRLILTVGVNLNEAADSDPEKMERAIGALQKMGYLKDMGVRRGS